MSVSVRTRALAGVVVAGGMLAAGVLVSPSTALAAVQSLATDPLSFAIVVAGLYLVRPLLAWPTTPLAAVVGYGYGIALGIPIALVGVVTTVLPVFLVVRRLTGSEPAATGRAHSSDDTVVRDDVETGPIDRLLERTGTVVTRYYATTGPLRGVIASRLAPIPSDVATCAAAVSGVGLRQLVLGTAIGELPWTVAAVAVGASAATVRTDGLGNLGLALGVACLAAAIALLAGPAYRVARTQRGTESRTTSRPTDR